MVAHRRLREADRRREVASARLRVRARRDQAEEAQPGGIREGLEGTGERLGGVLAERRRQERRAAGVEFLDELHQVILTDIDVSGNISTAIDAMARFELGGDPGWIRTAARLAAARHVRGGVRGRRPRLPPPAVASPPHGASLRDRRRPGYRRLRAHSRPRARVGAICRARARGGRGASPRLPARARPPGIGRLVGGGARRRHPRGGGRRPPGGGRAHAGDRVPDDRRRGGCGRGDLRFAQPSRVQRHQVLRPERHEAPGRRRGQDRGGTRRPGPSGDRRGLDP